MLRDCWTTAGILRSGACVGCHDRHKHRLEFCSVRLQANQLGTELSNTIVAMITSNMARAGHPSGITVLASSESARRSGLLMDSVIMTDNLATVYYSEIDRVIWTFPGTTELDAALRATLGPVTLTNFRRVSVRDS